MNQMADVFAALYPAPGIEGVAISRSLGSAAIVLHQLPDVFAEWGTGRLWLSAFLGPVSAGNTLTAYEALLGMSANPDRNGGLVVSVSGAGGQLKLSAPAPLALPEITHSILRELLVAFASLAQAWTAELQSPQFDESSIAQMVPAHLCA